MATEDERELWRSDPDAAYAEAERRIEAALESGATALNFGVDDSPKAPSEGILGALNRLPPQIARLDRLTRLDLDNTQMADIAPLANFTALQLLNLNRTQVADIAPLANLTALQWLNLDGTPVADIAPLANLTALQRLDLDGTQVADIAPLANLTALQRLDLNNTQVADIAPLANLTALQTLYLNDTQVADITPIARIDRLLEAAREQDAPYGLSYANTPLAKQPVFRDLVELDTPECTIQTLQYLRGDHPDHNEPPPSIAPSSNQPPPSEPRLVRVSSPADFERIGVDDAPRIDVQLKPVNPAPAQASAVPINAETRDSLLHGLHAIAKEVDRSLGAYRKEGDGSNRVEAARQIAGGARQLIRQTAERGEDFIAPLFHRIVESMAAAWLEDAPALEAYDRELIRGLLEDARKLYAFYPVLAEIDSPTNAELIPENLASQADDFVAKVEKLVKSDAGRAVFTDKTREVIEAELNATTPVGVDERKWKLRRFGALVGRMKEKVDPIAERLREEAPDSQTTANYITISMGVSQLWAVVAPFLGL